MADQQIMVDSPEFLMFVKINAVDLSIYSVEV